jgi:hypothetical protein
MAFEGIAGLLIFALIAAVAIRRVFTRRGRSSIGSAAAGSVYDWMNKDKREALEIVVEERAEARDPENADGNLPDLARGRAREHRD